jgi:hypothetical protein
MSKNWKGELNILLSSEARRLAATKKLGTQMEYEVGQMTFFRKKTVKRPF